MRQALPIIGWREWIALPDLGVERLKAKVDTGARTSSLHAVHVEKIRRRGKDLARFVVHPKQRDSETELVVTAPILDFRYVKSSSGHRELRPVIETRIELFGETWPIEVTLAARDMMGFRMLLGRQALARRFTVDPSRSFLSRAARSGVARGGRR